MKRVYILPFILAILFIQCKKADESSDSSVETLEYSLGSELKGEYTLFAVNKGKNMSQTVTRLNISRLNIISYYINGIKYDYNSDGALELLSESTFDSDSYTLLDNKREVVNFDGTELLIERGVIDYKSQFSGSGVKLQSTLEVDNIGKSFSTLFNRLITKAVRESGHKGRRGTIYPVEAVTVGFKGSRMTLTANFLLFED